MLRAGPFSDERVRGLINARFLPIYFDLNSSAPAADAGARKLVVALKPGLGKASVPTPPVLIVNADGELLAEVSNYASETEMRRALLQVLERHPQYALPDEAELKASPIHRARIAMLLDDDDGARALLAEESGDEALLLLAQMGRRAQDWASMRASLDRMSKGSSAVHEPLERAYAELAAGQYASMTDRLGTVDKQSPRYAEARYLYGIALYHRSRVEQAKAVWAALVEEIGESAWTYRADWAYSGADESAGGRRSFSTRGSKTLLGRHGYMGRRNPDLVR